MILISNIIPRIGRINWITAQIFTSLLCMVNYVHMGAFLVPQIFLATFSSSAAPPVWGIDDAFMGNESSRLCRDILISPLALFHSHERQFGSDFGDKASGWSQGAVEVMLIKLLLECNNWALSLTAEQENEAIKPMSQSHWVGAEACTGGWSSLWSLSLDVCEAQRYSSGILLCCITVVLLMPFVILCSWLLLSHTPHWQLLLLWWTQHSPVRKRSPASARQLYRIWSSS